MAKLLIPKIFHVIWLGYKPMPDEFVEYGKSWLRNHPDWEMKLWNSKNMIKLQNQEAYDRATSLAQKADIARYEIIYNFGGVYIDTDFECLKNIEELLENVEAFSAYESEGIVCASIIGCAPKNPVLKMLIDGIPESIDANKQYPINYQTGPIYVSNKLKERKDFTIFSSELFYPYLWDEKHRKYDTFPHAYAVHHWVGSWVKKEDLDNVPDTHRGKDIVNNEEDNKKLNVSDKTNILFRYRVKPGDSLEEIGKYFNITLGKYFSATIHDLIKINNITTPDNLDVGQTLYIPLKK